MADPKRPDSRVPARDAPGSRVPARKDPGRDPDTVLRPVSRPAERRVRDLDNPTAQFPIGAMYRAVQRRSAEGGRSGPAIFEDQDDETELLDWDDEDEEGEFAEPSRRRSLDMWFFALWLAAAGVLGLLAAVAATAAVLYR